MIDKFKISGTRIYNEFDDNNRRYWFDFKQKKFLHNIDTFYYSVKFQQDFTFDSTDPKVKMFRKYFDTLYQDMEEKDLYGSTITCFFPGTDKLLNLKPFHYAGYYNICLECPDYFDIFFAPKVPHSADNGESVTCECVVQIRSYMLWMYGVRKSYEMSMEYIRAISDYFQLDIAFTQENRVDYAWHTNYIQNPEKFFDTKRFYKMRVDRFHGANIHTAKKGNEGFELDYIAMGKRSDKIFIRVYLKSKEVVEKGYKPWFFKVWLFNGLINRYDLYCYEYAFLKHSWQHLDYGRLAYYAEYGKDPELVDQCNKIISGEVTISDASLKELADRLTPKVNLIINVEYQTMRKHSKNYELIPFFDNKDKLTEKRIYDYLDNRKLICDYLTDKVFRLVEPPSSKYKDTNKSRRPMCAFWQALRRCRLDDAFVPEEERTLVRTYSRRLNAQVVKERAIKSAVTFGIYTKGINHDDPIQDAIEALCVLNDNDIESAIRFKNKKVLQFNEDELQDVMSDSPGSAATNLILINNNTGEVYASNSSTDL